MPVADEARQELRRAAADTPEQAMTDPEAAAFEAQRIAPTFLRGEALGERIEAVNEQIVAAAEEARQ